MKCLQVPRSSVGYVPRPQECSWFGNVQVLTTASGTKEGKYVTHQSGIEPSRCDNTELASTQEAPGKEEAVSARIPNLESSEIRDRVENELRAKIQRYESMILFVLVIGRKIRFLENKRLELIREVCFASIHAHQKCQKKYFAKNCVTSSLKFVSNDFNDLESDCGSSYACAELAFLMLAPTFVNSFIHNFLKMKSFCKDEKWDMMSFVRIFLRHFSFYNSWLLRFLAGHLSQPPPSTNILWVILSTISVC